MKEHASRPTAETPAAITHRPAKLARKCECPGEGPCECDEGGGAMQREAAGAAPARVPPVVHDVLASGGRPLDEGTRANMESRFGHDFSRVRVHDDARAAESAGAVSARAYTVGDHMVFAPGMYAPGSPGGQRLLAHELTHVVQQSGIVQTSPVAEISNPSDEGEREADQVADEVMGGGS